MANKCYLVSCGCYSDREVVGIFSTRELAQEYIDHVTKLAAQYEESPDYIYISRDFNDIVEYEIDRERKAVVHERFRAAIDITTGEMHAHSTGREFEIPASRAWTHPPTPVPSYRGKYTAFSESAKSLDHAKKLAVEARQRFIATHGKPPAPGARVDEEED